MAGGTAFRPQIQDASHRRNLWGKIFPPQIFKVGTFDFEEVLAFDEAVAIVAEIALDVVRRCFVEFGELCGRHDAFIAPFDTLKFLVEIDRRGATDAVFYDCENPDFEAYIAGKGFVTAQGSFSDISVIAPTLDVAAVNLSSGYYNAHRLHEYIVRSELEHTIQKVCEIVAESTREEIPRYEFAPRNYFSSDLRGYAEHFLWADEVVIPDDLPEEYHEIYAELLAVYPADQLDEIRATYGNQFLWQMYRDEFGSPFFDR